MSARLYKVLLDCTMSLPLPRWLSFCQCLSIFCLCLWLKHFSTDFSGIFRQYWSWYKQDINCFWWGSKNGCGFSFKCLLILWDRSVLHSLSNFGQQWQKCLWGGLWSSSTFWMFFLPSVLCLFVTDNHSLHRKEVSGNKLVTESIIRIC